MSKNDIFKNEVRIRKIGGRLLSDYYTFRNSVVFVNENYIPLFYLLGFNHPEDRDIIIDCLLNSSITIAAKRAYIAKRMEQAASGKLKLEKLLSKRTLTKEYDTPEEKEKVFKRATHRALVFRYNKIEDIWKEEYKPYLYGYGSFTKLPLKLCREALSLSEEGLYIDVDKFIGIYSDHLKASGSKRGKLHQEAADAINRFFGGAVEITDKEMKMYFSLSNGIVIPNPTSINEEGYLRLG
jgi:hypothetical protein